MTAEKIEIKERWEEFYRRYYKNEIGKVAQGEKSSLEVKCGHIEQYDPDLADDLVLHPDSMRGAAEDALSDFDIAADASLESAPVRFSEFYPTTEITSIDSDDIGKMVSVVGLVCDATEANLNITDAAFECQRCGTLTTVEQSGQELSEPHQCRGCERQGPFRLLEDRSDFVKSQKIRLGQVRGDFGQGKGKQIDVNLEGDITGKVSEGDRARATGVLRAERASDRNTFELFIEANNVESISIDDQEEVPDWYPTEDLHGFVERASEAIATTEGMSEAGVKNRIITPLLGILGWDMFRDIRLEYTALGDRVDYALLSDSGSEVCVEAKSVNQNLNRHTEQVRKYVRQTEAKYGLLTNGERYVLFEEDADAVDETLIMDSQLGGLVDNQQKLERIHRRNFG
jgi:predicted RNA-binding Zn-ribbon protein involved in translation (DUF1610 family)